MAENTRQMLGRELEEDIRDLSNLLGRDLVSLWLPHTQTASTTTATST
jgi:hypothetical protein